MAKCAICSLRKGKRRCLLHAGEVCPLCCASTRRVEACAICSFFRPQQRDYGELPRYSTVEMADSDHLQKIAYPIEAEVCSWDRDRRFHLKDADVIEVFEVLLDLYGFGDSPETVSDRVNRLGCQRVIQGLGHQLRRYDRNEIVKVIGVVRFTAKRRTLGGREHIDLLHHYCGAFVQSDVSRRSFSEFP